jgi:hypothetical protein
LHLFVYNSRALWLRQAHQDAMSRCEAHQDAMSRCEAHQDAMSRCDPSASDGTWHLFSKTSPGAIRIGLKIHSFSLKILKKNKY